MKKLITTVALTLLTLCTFAQDFSMSIYKVEVYSYNTIDEKWDIYKTFTPDHMNLIKRDNIITITNQDRSRFTIDTPLESNTKDCLNFVAKDREGELCGLQFCIVSDRDQLGQMAVMYVGKMLILYHFQPEHKQIN